MKTVLKLAAAAVAIVAVAMGVGYWRFPSLAQPIVGAVLGGVGATEFTMQTGRPGWSALHVDALGLVYDGQRISARDVDLEYTLGGLVNGRVVSIAAGEVHAALGNGDADGSGLPALLAPAMLWDMVPADRVDIDAFTVEGFPVAVTGRLSLRPDQAVVDMSVLDLDVGLRADRSGALTVDLRTSQADGAASTATIDATIDTESETVRANVVAELHVESLQHLVEVPGVDGRIEVEIELEVPWQSTLAALIDAMTADGHYHLTATDPANGVTVALAGRVRLLARRVSIDIDNGSHAHVADQSWRVDPLATIAFDVAIDRFPDIDWTAGISGALDATAVHVEAAGRYVSAAQEVTATGTVDVGYTTAPFTADYSLDRSAATLRIDHRFDVSTPLLAALFPEQAFVADLEAGTIELAVVGSYAPAGGALGTVHVALENGVSQTDAVTATGLAATADATYADGEFILGDIAIAIAAVDVGFPVEAVQAEIRVVSLEPLIVAVRSVTGRALGATFSIGAFDYDVTRDNAQFDLAVDGLALAEVLALEGESFSGDGVLDGAIPVRLEAGMLTVEGGSLSARAPGGKIRYVDALSTAAAINQPGVDFAVSALGDFRYERLDVTADYVADGTLSLGIRLEGSNPNVENGRSIHYNLNVTENLPALLKSLQLSDELSAQVEKRVNR